MLSIGDIRLWFYLGCSEEERAHQQQVSLQVDVLFHTPPQGVKTDKIDDTFCYVSLLKALENLSRERSFHLIEHLAFHVHKTVMEQKHHPHISKVMVTIKKIAPPVPYIHGGVSFTYSGS